MLDWTKIINSETAVIVPTRSLQDIVAHQILESNVQQGKRIFESPNVLTWSDVLAHLYTHNQFEVLSNNDFETLLTPLQASVLWQQIIGSSKREDENLILLNVSQTAQAVQTSWQLVHDWQCDLANLQAYNAQETNQLLQWFDQYKNALQKRKLADKTILSTYLLQLKNVRLPWQKCIWYSYDLMTDMQRQFCEKFELQGTQIEQYALSQNTGSKNTFHCYLDEKQELRAVLQAARAQLEKNAGARINIVVPKLNNKRAWLETLCKEVFYADVSPLQTKRMPLVYRFSLGSPLHEWPAIHIALLLIRILQQPLDMQALTHIFESEFLPFKHHYVYQVRRLILQLRKTRLSRFTLSELAEHTKRLASESKASEDIAFAHYFTELEQQQIALSETIQAQKNRRGFGTLAIDAWLDIFTQCLSLWGWSTQDQDNSSVSYQLAQRWESLLVELAEVKTVQSHFTLRGAIEIMRKIVSDSVFQPQASYAPIIISGLYETIGRPVDICYLTGMNESYPSVLTQDAFVPQSVLNETNHPSRNASVHRAQAKKVIDSVLQSAEKAVISYSQFDEQDSEIAQSCSPLFKAEFSDVPVESKVAENTSQCPSVLHEYSDTIGQALSANSKVRGGSSIITNQSHCPFKAYFTHRLGFDEMQECDFAIDHLDKGNIVHSILEAAWKKLENQTNLCNMSDANLEHFCTQIVEASIENIQRDLNEEKSILVELEKTRFKYLLLNSLQVDKAREQSFRVQEIEKKYAIDLDGMQFHCIVDRIDVLENGASLLIDYKTGQVSKSDWLKERIKNPQLLLYMLVLEQKEGFDFDGIAYFKIHSNEVKYEGITQLGVLSPAKKNASHEDWLQQKEEWRVKIRALMDDFKAGDAKVHPIDDTVCQYCDISAVCRINQLRHARLQVS